MVNWQDYDRAGWDFEDWPVEAQDQWREHMELAREEKWDREHRLDEEKED